MIRPELASTRYFALHLLCGSNSEVCVHANLYKAVGIMNGKHLDHIDFPVCGS